MYTIGRLRLFKNSEKMTIYLRMGVFYLNMRKMNKKADIKTVLGIAFLVLLALAVLWIMKKSGTFQTQTFVKLKEKLYPFG